MSFSSPVAMKTQSGTIVEVWRIDDTLVDRNSNTPISSIKKLEPTRYQLEDGTAVEEIREDVWIHPETREELTLFTN